MTTPSADRPALRIVHGGEPTAEELAALVVALSAAQPGAGADEETATGSRWADREQMLRRPLPHGPGAWWRSGYWAGA